MQVFDIRGPAGWELVIGGEVLHLPATGQRQVRLAVNTTGRFSVFVASSADMADRVLLASCDGLFRVAYAADGDSYVQFECSDGSIAYVCSEIREQRVSATADVVFTTLVPGARRNTDYDRMVQFVKFNEARRDAALNAEIERLRAAGVRDARHVAVGESPVVVETDGTA